MNASRVVVSEDTRIAQDIRSKELQDMRRMRVLNFIRSQPTGKMLTLGQLGTAAGIKKGSIHAYIRSLVDQGYLRKIPMMDGFGNSWEVVGDAQVVAHVPVNALKLKRSDKDKLKKYRVELAKNYVLSRPGKYITKQEIGIAASVPRTSRSWFADHLVDIGVLSRQVVPGKKQIYTWTVNAGSEPEQEEAPKDLTPLPYLPQSLNPPAELPKPDNNAIIEKAKSFVWDKNSDSLREFIKWLEEEQR